MKKTQAWLVVAAIGAALLLLVGAALSLRPSPQAALEAFYTRASSIETAVPEETLTDPLIVAGDRVAPLVISEIRKVSMPNRRYAIGFLGKGRYREALPTLLHIVEDETESHLIRGTTLESIWHIDEAEGRRLAMRYSGRSDHLGERAAMLLGGETSFAPQRTFLEAALGWLDP